MTQGRATGWLTRQVHDRLVPAQPIGRRLAAISLLDAIGSGMYYTGAALYFTLVVRLTPGQVGAGLSLGALAGLLGSVPVGLLADRARAGHVYIGLQVLRGLAFTGYCVVKTFPLFALVSVFAGLTEAALPPVQQAVVGAVIPGEARIDTLAKVRAVRNVGFGIGALLASAAIGDGSRLAFLVLVGGNALSYFLVAAGLARAGIARVTVSAGNPPRATRFVPDLRYTLTSVLFGVLAVNSTLLVVAMPLWFTRHTTMPAPLVGVLIAVNTVMAILMQVRIARRAGTVRGAVRAAALAGLALAGFGVACQAAHAVPSLAIVLAFAAVILLTLGELWQSAGGWTLSYELADPSRRTAYLSTFQLGNSLQAVVAPWLILNLLFPTPGGWLIFSVVIAATGIAARAVVPRTRPADLAAAVPANRP